MTALPDVSRAGGLTFTYNNGADDPPQTAGSRISIGTNVCGNDKTYA